MGLGVHYLPALDGFSIAPGTRRQNVRGKFGIPVSVKSQHHIRPDISAVYAIDSFVTDNQTAATQVCAGSDGRQAKP